MTVTGYQKEKRIGAKSIDHDKNPGRISRSLRIISSQNKKIPPPNSSPKAIKEEITFPKIQEEIANRSMPNETLVAL